MAQLTLHNVYGRFRNDMFLSSLTESGTGYIYSFESRDQTNELAIAVPMGMISKRGHVITPATQDLLNILDNAAKLFWTNLSLANNGCVPDIRNATISLALISAFKTSLGRPGKGEPSVAAGLLGKSKTCAHTRT
jgi:separase